MRRGFTLVEVLVSGALLIVVGLVVLALLLWALDGTAAGQVQQLTQQDARNALETLRSDLNQSVVPPLGTSGSLLVPSGVLIPTSYQTIPTQDGFTQETPTPVNPVTLSSTNLVAFTVPNKSISSFIPTLLSDESGKAEYCLVVYYVTDSTGQDVTQYLSLDASGNPVPNSARGVHGADQSTEGGHVLWKNVYDVTSAFPLLNGSPANEWTVDVNQLNGPNGKPVTVGGGVNDPTQQSQVLALNPGDALMFTVSHANLNNGTDPTYQTIADRHVFQLQVVVERQVPMHLGRAQTKVVRMNDTATMRTFQ